MWELQNYRSYNLEELQTRWELHRIKEELKKEKKKSYIYFVTPLLTLPFFLTLDVHHGTPPPTQACSNVGTPPPHTSVVTSYPEPAPRRLPSLLFTSYPEPAPWRRPSPRVLLARSPWAPPFWSQRLCFRTKPLQGRENDVIRVTCLSGTEPRLTKTLVLQPLSILALTWAV